MSDKDHCLEKVVACPAEKGVSIENMVGRRPKLIVFLLGLGEAQEQEACCFALQKSKT